VLKVYDSVYSLCLCRANTEIGLSSSQWTELNRPYG
jgi:hypothetical protein